MQRMRQAVRHFQQPLSPQADSQKFGLPIGEEVHDLRQSLCQHAGLGDAPTNAQAVTHLRHLRQAILQALAAPGPPEVTYGRETVRMRPLWQGLRGPFQSEGAHADPFLR